MRGLTPFFHPVSRTQGVLGQSRAGWACTHKLAVRWLQSLRTHHRGAMREPRRASSGLTAVVARFRITWV